MTSIPETGPPHPPPREFRTPDYFKIVVFGAALALFWTTLHTIVLPLRVLDHVGEAQKNTYLGILTFAGLLIAMVVQPLAGAASDRSRWGWGRRRPFILMGGLLALLFLPGVGLAWAYLALLATYCLLQIVCNLAQGPFQAFIPDLVARHKRGLASGVKGLTETLGTIAFFPLISYYLIKPYSLTGEVLWLWLALTVLGAALLGAMITTLILVKEAPPKEPAPSPLIPTLLNTYRIDVKGNPSFLWFLGSRLLILMATGTVQTFAYYFLKDYVKVPHPEDLVWQLTATVGICLLVTIYPGGRLSDRIGRRPVVLVSGLGAAAAISLMIFATSSLHVLFCSGLLGVCLGGFMSSNWALATDLVPPGEEARYLGLTNLATAGASALARLIGPAIDFFNSLGAGMGYQVMLVTCVAYLLAGSLLVLKVSEPGAEARIA
ncbi:MAG TPA: SLC45 family MFS transporter [Dehalococcoidia bacterium]|nr:SLC45 family MFS transporter [Dehalococcoidia bacterium]